MRAFLGIGSVTPDYPAYRVRRGQLERAIGFFKELGWTVSEHNIPGSPWGPTRFVYPNGNSALRYLLIDGIGYSRRPTTYPATHFTLNVDHAEEAARAMKLWARDQGTKCEIEPLDEAHTQLLVKMNSIFTFQFELHQRPKCPRCDGSGQIPHMGSYDPDMPFDTCPVCKGARIDESI